MKGSSNLQPGSRGRVLKGSLVPRNMSKQHERNAIPPINNRSIKNARLKNRSNELVGLKKRSTATLHIEVDRFFRRTLSLDRFGC